MTSYFISVAKDFTKTPGGRYREDGPYSGAEFREDLVEPLMRKALAEGQILVIDVDGVSGFATSFLEETFGGLVRSLKRPIKRHIDILTQNPLRRREVEGYIADEEAKI